MSTFELVSRDVIPEEAGQAAAGLGYKVLLANARWFTRIRWIVVALLLVSAFLAELRPAFLRHLSIRLPATELWVLAGILMLVNVVFGTLVSFSRKTPDSWVVPVNIWLQIIVDLVVLTVLVHSVGSTTTFMPFAYLFHIVLACIFFSRRKSLFVTGLAAVLYLSCVALELRGHLQRTTVFANWESALQEQDITLASLFALSAIMVWLVVWYLVSSLSRAVQERDRQLAVANRQLLKADEAKTKQMLRTTHDLKAPFSGIESNIDLIRFKYWDDIPAGVQDLVERIELRAQTLRERIREILLLGDLKSKPREGGGQVSNVQQLIGEVVTELKEKAEERDVTVLVDVPAVRVQGDPRSLAILFANITSNAIVYSQSGGEVKITGIAKSGTLMVSVADAGIGINPEALPHIFEEYYHTQEAIEFNRMSTGLGLAIVKTIAVRDGIGLRVDSTVGKGTTFAVTLAIASPETAGQADSGKSGIPS